MMIQQIVTSTAIHPCKTGDMFFVVIYRGLDLSHVSVDFLLTISSRAVPRFELPICRQLCVTSNTSGPFI